MEKENSDISEIISQQNVIKDKSLSDKIEIKIQKNNKISIPSIILEIVNLSGEPTTGLDLNNLKNFFDNFGEVLNIVNLEKKVIILFKTFFHALICKKFFEKEHQIKEDKKSFIKVRWFDYEKDSNLLLREDVELIFSQIYEKNIGNIKPEMKNLLKNIGHNNIGIKMNMKMNINNFNINATMNPLGQAQNIPNLQQILQFQQLMRMNNNNINLQNINKIQLMQLAQMQNNMAKNGGLNLFINKQNNNNNVNDINNAKMMNNYMNTGNNNINIINNNMQLLSQMNPQFLQNQMKNLSLMNNNISNSHSDINAMNNNNKNQTSQPNIIFNNQNSNNNNNNNNYNDEKNFGKYTCKYEILIANDKGFEIAKKIIGKKGCNMKNIINGCKSNPDESDNVKLRLRGKGSGFKEGPDNKESDEPLHLCISSKNPEYMKKACLLVDELFKKVHEEYKKYCEENNVTPENTELAARIESKNYGYNGK
jgi:hypothetical protein